MEERSWWTWAAFLALGLAFGTVSLLLWASGGRHARLLRAKLRLGGLLLGLSAVASGCGEKEDTMVMCYDAGWDSDAYAEANIEVAEEALAFGAVELGTSSTQQLHVTNTGSLELTVSAITLADEAAPFTHDAELPAVVQTGAELVIEVGFTPTAVESYGTTLQIESNDSDTPSVAVELSGEGSAP